MRVAVAYGQKRIEYDVPEPDLVAVRRHSPAAALADPAEAVRAALETPFHFPALRRALTPDDHVAIVLDEELPQLAQLLTPILEHLLQAGIHSDAITLVCAPSSTGQPWLEDVPEQFENVRIEVHDRADRDRLSYLATTQQGRRIYLNRSVIDADQVVVLSRRNYDPLTGYGGAETALFPALSDAATLKVVQKQLSLKPPGAVPWPLEREATEVAWLLGAPFLVQVIEGADTAINNVIGGTLDSSTEGRRLLDAAWRAEVEKPADVVVASMGGDVSRHDFRELSRALANAARVVKPGGRIVLLTDSTPALGPEARLLREAGDSQQALQRLAGNDLLGREAAFEWASAADQATIYLLSRLPQEQAEELFTVPLEDAGQVQRLLGAGRSCVVLPEAHKMMAVVKNGR